MNHKGNGTEEGARAAPRLIGSEIYRGSTYGAWHPLAIPRVSTMLDLSRALGWVDPGAYLVSPRAKPAALAAWHSPDYIAAVEAAEASGSVSAAVRDRYHLGTHANPVYPEVYRRPATACGGSILAGELLAGAGGVIHSPAGGTHHGMPDRANGFCYFNDPVLGILSLRRSGLSRVAYVDIDAHHSDGVEFAFADDPDVLQISVHEEKRWPFTGALEDRGAGTVWNLPVPKGFNDTEMSAVLERLILPRLTAFGADALVLQCGADAVEEDPLSRLALSNNAHFAVVRALIAAVPRVLVLGGGGYNPWSVGRLWTGVWGVIAGREMPERLPEAGEKIMRSLVWPGRKAGRAPPEHWMTTLVDAPRPGPISEAVNDRLKVLEDRATVWV